MKLFSRMNIDQVVYRLYGLTPAEIAIVEGGEKCQARGGTILAYQHLAAPCLALPPTN